MPVFERVCASTVLTMTAQASAGPGVPSGKGLPGSEPGTSTEYSNWTRRMTASARDIFARPEVRELAAALVEARKVVRAEPGAGALP